MFPQELTSYKSLSHRNVVFPLEQYNMMDTFNRVIIAEGFKKTNV